MQKRNPNQGASKLSTGSAYSTGSAASTADMDSGLGLNQQLSQDSRNSTASVSMDSGVGMKQESGNAHEGIDHSPKVKIGKAYRYSTVLNKVASDRAKPTPGIRG